MWIRGSDHSFENGFAIFSWAVKVGSKGHVWVFMSSMWKVAASVWGVADAMGTASGAMGDNIGSRWDAHALCGMLKHMRGRS